MFILPFLRLPSRYLAFFLSSVGLTVSGLAEKYVLQYTFEPDKTYQYRQNSTIALQMNNPVTQAPMDMRTEMTLQYRFDTQADPNGVQVVMAFDQLEMEVHTGEVEMMRFDSKAPAGENPMLEGLFGPLTELKLSGVMNPEGQLVSVESEGLKKEFEQFGFDQKTLEQMITQGLSMMPDQPVSVGETWSTTMEMPLGGLSKVPALAEVQYALKEVVALNGSRQAVIDFSGDLDLAIGPDEGSALAIKTSQYSGTVWHNLDLNMTQKAQSTVEMTITLAQGETAQANGLQEIPQKITTTLELIK